MGLGDLFWIFGFMWDFGVFGFVWNFSVFGGYKWHFRISVGFLNLFGIMCSIWKVRINGVWRFI